MKKLELEAIKANTITAIQNSKEVIEKIKVDIDDSIDVDINLRMINYEKGMIRGLERSLEMIEDLDAVVEDYKAKLKG